MEKRVVLLQKLLLKIGLLVSMPVRWIRCLSIIDQNINFEFFSISVKEGCLSLGIHHFGEILDTLIPRRRIFGRLQWEIHSIMNA